MPFSTGGRESHRGGLSPRDPRGSAPRALPLAGCYNAEVPAAALLVAALLLPAEAADRAPTPPKTAEHILTHGLWLAANESARFIALTGGWAASARAWDDPYPGGLASLATGRLLYGTSWAVLLVGEVAVAHAIVGDTWAGLGQAAYRTDWLFGHRTPGGCPPGGDAGCGLGLGGYAELSARLTGSPVPLQYALGGGWIQGRSAHDARRTVMRSTWVVCPASLRAVLPLRIGPVRVEGKLGPGLYGGMHNAHVHPTGGPEADIPTHELVPLHFGVGPGGHAALSIALFDAVSLDADADLAALVLGGSNGDPPPSVAPPLASAGAGSVRWRRLSLSVATPLLEPLRVGVGYWAAELSPGPLDRLGHGAWLLRVDVPLRID